MARLVKIADPVKLEGTPSDDFFEIIQVCFDRLVISLDSLFNEVRCECEGELQNAHRRVSRVEIL